MVRSWVYSSPASSSTSSASVSSIVKHISASKHDHPNAFRSKIPVTSSLNIAARESRLQDYHDSDIVKKKASDGQSIIPLTLYLKDPCLIILPRFPSPIMLIIILQQNWNTARSLVLSITILCLYHLSLHLCKLCRNTARQNVA